MLIPVGSISICSISLRRFLFFWASGSTDTSREVQESTRQRSSPRLGLCILSRLPLLSMFSGKAGAARLAQVSSRLRSSSRDVLLRQPWHKISRAVIHSAIPLPRRRVPRQFQVSLDSAGCPDCPKVTGTRQAGDMRAKGHGLREHDIETSRVHSNGEGWKMDQGYSEWKRTHPSSRQSNDMASSQGKDTHQDGGKEEG